MKTAYGCVLSVLVAAALLAMGAAAPDNAPLQVKNGSMEEVADKSLLPVAYSPLGEGLMFVDSTVAFEGKRSVKLVLRGQFENFGFCQQVASTAPEGSLCHFRAHVRTHDLRGKADFDIYRYPNPEQTFRSAQPVSGTQDWTTIEATVPAKKGGNQFQVRMMVTGTVGQVWFDNLEAWVEDKK